MDRFLGQNSSNVLKQVLKFLIKDIVKGSETLESDRYPLSYFGSRDRYFRIVSPAQVVNIDDEWDEERDVLFQEYTDINERNK